MTNAIEIERSSSQMHIVAKFPLPLNKHAIGAEIVSSDIGEVTASTLTVNNWLDAKASNFPTTTTTPEPLTLERYFAKYARALIDGGLPNSSIYTGYLGAVPVIIFDLKLPLNSDYNPALQSLQLDKIGGGNSNAPV